MCERMFLSKYLGCHLREIFSERLCLFVSTIFRIYIYIIISILIILISEFLEKAIEDKAVCKIQP